MYLIDNNSHKCKMANVFLRNIHKVILQKKVPCFLYKVENKSTRMFLAKVISALSYRIQL